jgi:hypothetical protein
VVARNKYGPFHRLHSPTQDEQTRASNLTALLGRAARWSHLLSVKAYRGPLPRGAEGIEFSTHTAPSPGSHPTLVFWYEGNVAVRVMSTSGQDLR